MPQVLRSCRAAWHDAAAARKSTPHLGCALEDGDEVGRVIDETFDTVMGAIAEEGVFSCGAVAVEVRDFLEGLARHPVYFRRFAPLQIAEHVHCLLAARRVARATGDADRAAFSLRGGPSAFFLTTAAGSRQPAAAQERAEEAVAELLEAARAEHRSASVAFLASDGPILEGAAERLGIYSVELGSFDASSASDCEVSLERLASSRFFQEQTAAAKLRHQRVMEDVVASRASVVHIALDSGARPRGCTLTFGSAEATGRCFLTEVCRALRLEGLSPSTFQLETFANGVFIYSVSLPPSARQEQIYRLKRTILQGALLPPGDGKICRSVVRAEITHEAGLYLLAAAKFVYAFFPRELYAPEYAAVLEALGHDADGRWKFQALYERCVKDFLSVDRICDIVHQHLRLAPELFADFRQIALGQTAPCFNAALGAAIDAACSEEQERLILRMFLTFNASLRMTNFFQAETPGALAFRLDPAVVLEGRPASRYPAMPYGLYLISGRDFSGFHVRFRDVARGGIRLVRSRDRSTYERNLASLFDECYNLALTQQYKNKDIPEGGAKGVILPDLGVSQSPAAQRSCFVRYLNSLLDCMLPKQSGIYAGHLQGHGELLFFGPDENTAGFMDLGAELARTRGYPHWKALTTGKSVRLGGVPHDTYGMTTASVHAYVTELLRELGEEESAVTKFQTGGPDGDLGSNEILVSQDRTIAVVDGSGVLYDPAGIDRRELVRLAKLRQPVRHFSRSLLGQGGFLVAVDEADVTLPDGSCWRTGTELRDRFHLTSYASADLFVPCGGRPNAVTEENVGSLFQAGRPKFRMIVEGANLFFSDAARRVLEDAGVHVFKDASANKGGVTSSSLEVLAAMALSVDDHSTLMSYDPEDCGEPPEFYSTYVRQIIDIIVDNAKEEFRAIWACNRADGVPKVEATRRLSCKINQLADSIQESILSSMPQEEKEQLVRAVLQRAVPRVILQRIGVAGILKRVPPNYVAAIVGSWVASRFVYKYGIDASEVSYFSFMRSLLGGATELQTTSRRDPHTARRGAERDRSGAALNTRRT